MKISLNTRIQDLDVPRLNYDDRGDKQGLDPCVYSYLDILFKTDSPKHIKYSPNQPHTLRLAR